MPSSLRRSVVARNQKLAVSQGEPLDGSLVIYRFGPVKQMRGYVKRMLTTFEKLPTLRGGLRLNSVFALVPYRSGWNPTDGGTRLESRASGGAYYLCQIR